MINPIESAYNLFIKFFEATPAPIQYFVGLAFGLIVISTIISMIFRG